MDQSMLIDEILARVAAKLAAAEDAPDTAADPAGAVPDGRSVLLPDVEQLCAEGTF